MSDYGSLICNQQHKVAWEIIVFPGDIVIAKLHVPIANSNRFSPKFTGQYRVIEVASGNKFYIQNLETGEINIRHVDDFKMENMTYTKILILYVEENYHET